MMRPFLAALAALCMGLALLGGPASASPRHRHHRVRYHTVRTHTVRVRRHTRPANALDSFSRGFNHEVNNASKSVNHTFQGKKPTPQGNR